VTRDAQKFLQMLASRVPPAKGVVLKTKKGEIVISYDEKRILDAICITEGRSGTDLVNEYL